MVTRGLLVRIPCAHGKDGEMEAFLQSALPLARNEPETRAWYAIRFGRSEYGVVDVFADEAGRDAHLNGPIAKALMEKVGTLLPEAPVIRKFDVLAHKLPPHAGSQPDTKAVLLTFKAKEGHESDVEKFLKDAQPLAEQEPETTSWFAIRLEEGEFGIFDTFPDQGGRFSHLVGQIPREMLKHSLTLLGSLPDPELPTVIAEKL